MSTAVNAAFAEYLSRIELNPTRRDLASTRYNAAKATLEAALHGASGRQIGSFQRKTKIRPLGLGDGLDVDALVVFGEARRYASDGAGLTPEGAHSRVHRALTSNEIYKVMEPVKDAPTVMLEYADKDGFTIELVPAFVEVTGKYPRPPGPPCYIIAGPGGQWLPADYDYDASVISGINQSAAVQKSLVPVIKLAKVFFRSMQIEWKSFHVEVAVATTLPDLLKRWVADGAVWDIPEAFMGCLYLIEGQMERALTLPGSYSPAVASGIDPSIMGKAREYVRNRAEEAQRLLKLDDSRALLGWRAFFGEAFPAQSGGSR